MRQTLTTFVAMVVASLGLAIMPVGASAQMTTIDPNTAIDADLDKPTAAPRQSDTMSNDPSYDGDLLSDDGVTTSNQGATEPNSAATTATSGNTYKKDDLIGAAEGVFGKGAQGLAGLIEDILKKQGEPNAYIVGREAGGALVVGVRYGSGTLYHKIEGELPAYWTGPSIGFDAGANAGNTFVLVYNLFDSEDLYQRYPAGEGTAYLLGGFNASYLRRGDVVLIPIRVGVGARLGANVGYMKFRKKQSWSPF